MKILKARWVLPINRPAFQEGAVVIEEGQIIDVGIAAEILPKYSEAEVEDFPSCALLPGLVNAHTEVDLLFFRPTGETPQFFDGLIHTWNHRRCLTPAQRRHAYEEGIRQLLRSGTTTMGDSGCYVGVVAQIVNSPIRAVLFPEILSGQPTAVSDSYESVMSQVDEILAAVSTSQGLVNAGVAPYAAYTLSRHLLKVLAEQSRRLNIPLKIHAAETFSEMQFFYESNGEIVEKIFPLMQWGSDFPPPYRKTPIQYLDSIGFFEGGGAVIGGNNLADPDLEVLARQKMTLIHCPRASHRFKLGIPPLKKLRQLHIAVTLGTGGTAWAHSLSLWDEMRHILTHYSEPSKPSPDELLSMVTLEGARALGLENLVGSLEVGKEADLIAISLPQKESFDSSNLAKGLIENTTDREVAAIFIRGQKIKL